MCFFKVKHYFGHISGMVGPIDVKRKGSALIGYWVQYVTLTFDLPHDLDLGCFKVKFRNSSICRIVGLIDVKWKGSELIWYWANCMTLPFDHIHDLDLGVSRSESEIALSQEWGSLLTMNEKDASHPLMTMILTCVTMVGWADVPDSDWGDFRRRRAVNISSFPCIKPNLLEDDILSVQVNITVEWTAEDLVDCKSPWPRNGLVPLSNKPLQQAITWTSVHQDLLKILLGQKSQRKTSKSKYTFFTVNNMWFMPVHIHRHAFHFYSSCDNWKCDTVWYWLLIVPSSL